MPACGGAADHAGSAIHKVNAVARDHGDCRAHAVRLRIRRAGAQQDDARVLRPCRDAIPKESQPYKMHLDIVDWKRCPMF